MFGLAGETDKAAPIFELARSTESKSKLLKNCEYFSFNISYITTEKGICLFFSVTDRAFLNDRKK